MKSIRKKIMLCMILTVFISLFLVGSISIYLNYSSTVDTLKQTMQKTAQTAAQRVEKELEVYKSLTYESGCVERLSSAAISVERKKEVIDQKAKAYNFQRGNIIGLDGISIFDGNDYSDRDYFQKSIKGESAVSSPLISKITGEVTIIVSAPLWENGVPNSKIVGVVYYVPKETFLNDIVVSLQVSKGGSSYIINKEGTTIAHKNMDNVKNQENTQEDAKTDKALAKLAEMENKMTQNESGFGRYEYGGVKKFLAYAPIQGTDGWSIGINAPLSDFLSSTLIGIIIVVVLLGAALAVAAFIAFSLAKRIGDPMKACARRIQELAKGDLDSPVPVVNTKDETLLLAESSKELVDGINVMIKDVNYLLGEMAEGNLDVRTRAEEAYVGGFSGILTSIRTLNKGLSDTMAQINQASEQVASGSDQVSAGAQALSQGATEQASSVQELAATLGDISSRVDRNAKNSMEASQQAQQTTNELSVGKDQMHRMTEAMDEINHTSGEIGKIIKTIEDIAFQTNILALNAAVEAARAGEAGKGFAVVADEVRNLASKSAEASNNTSALIENSIQSVQRGAEIVNQTAESLERVVGSSQRTAVLVQEISGASQEQADALDQITQGIDQISSVVQTNSATAEESAAASEELSSQAQMMKELVGKFKLRD